MLGFRLGALRSVGAWPRLIVIILYSKFEVVIKFENESRTIIDLIHHAHITYPPIMDPSIFCCGECEAFLEFFYR